MRTSTRWLILAVAVVALLASAGTASADSFTINFSGSGFNGTLDVDTTLVSSGVYSIDTISGNVGFTPVTGLVPTTTSTGSYYSLPDGSAWFYDNLLFASSDPVVDNGGILFTLAGLAQPVNLFSDSQGEFGIYIGGGNSPNDFVINPVQVSVVSTPEPSALVLGLGGLAFLLACLAKRKFAAPILSRQSA
jgi:hypothetical protein